MHSPGLPLCVFLILYVFSSVEAQVAQQIPRLEIQDNGATVVYEEVVVVKVTETGVRIAHKDGLATLSFSKLPPDLRGTYEALRPKPVAPAPSALPGMSPAGSTDGGASALASFDPNCVVLIRTNVFSGSPGGSGSSGGSGFIAREGGINYVYTNAHVICGEPGGFTSSIASITTAQGRSIPIPEEIELSGEFNPDIPMGLEDLARFPVAVVNENPYDIASIGAVSATLNQDVVAFGDSKGGGVITMLEGKVLGVAADRFEMSCEIVKGNSGGPVLVKETRQVVGVTTYIAMGSGERDIWSKGTRFVNPRRFAVRPEKVTRWHKMSTTSLMTTLKALNGYDIDTLMLGVGGVLIPKSNRGGFDIPNIQRGDYNILDLVQHGSQNYLGRTISQGIDSVNERLGRLGAVNSKVKISKASVIPVFEKFFTDVLAQSQRQSKLLVQSPRPPYLKKFDASLIMDRQKMEENFAAHKERFVTID